MPKQRSKEEMRAYQKRRRLVTPDVTPAGNVTPDTLKDVTPAGNVTPDVTPDTEARRLWLRARLDAYRDEWLSLCRLTPQPDRLGAINEEREPLFRELHHLEQGCEGHYPMPVRFVNEGRSFVR